MGKVKPLKLSKGTRVGSYRIDRPLGRGWEGEVYAVEEVPTAAERAMKLIARQVDVSTRVVVHTAWFFEQLASSGAVARYFHMGTWFLEDNEGLFFLVFERLHGKTLKDYIEDEQDAWTEQRALRMVRQVAEAIARVHALGYAVGDFDTGTNIVVTGDAADPRPIFCDLDPGAPDAPNTNFANDAEELLTLARWLAPKKQSSEMKGALDLLRDAAQSQVNRRTFGALIGKMSAW
jgi:tRNA A-37 threonylcarbamoyl transferase component Bud32